MSGGYEQHCPACGLPGASGDNKAELHKVKVSSSIDGKSVVDEGLSPGQQVITGGQFKVQPGTLVTTAVASQEPAQAKVRQE